MEKTILGLKYGVKSKGGRENFEKNIDFSCSFLGRSPNLGYIFTPRPSYFKVLAPPLYV
jgi:hypothetical protein